MAAEFISVSFPECVERPEPAYATPPWILAIWSDTHAHSTTTGFNYTLIPYASSSLDPFTTGATVLAHTKNIKIIVALEAEDRLSDGRSQIVGHP